MRRAFWAAIGVSLISMVFVACEKEKEEKEDPTYLVQVTAAEGGIVEGQSGEYKERQTVVFKAIPDDGYFFSQWSDGKTDNPRTINVGKADITITAEFGFVTISGDLGLESGTIWATCNVGAANPWDYGDYYAWGETQTKDDYSWETYKYCKGSNETLTKYCYDLGYGDYGFTDTIFNLEATDNVATAVLGGGWTIPTNEEWTELGNQCYWVWTYNYNGTNVAGYIVYKAKSAGDKGGKIYADDISSASYSLSDAHIFMPAAGVFIRTNLYNVDTIGRYWSSSLYECYPYYAYDCAFFSSYIRPSENDYRYQGYSVRPIKRP